MDWKAVSAASKAAAAAAPPSAPFVSERERVARATEEAEKHAVFVNNLNFSHGDNQVLRNGEPTPLPPGGPRALAARGQ